MKCEPLETVKHVLLSEALSASGRGKIRYIGGYVVAKLKYKMSVKVRNSLFVRNKESELEKLQSQLDILNGLCISYDDLKNVTNDLESLEEIKRKQNDRESLTNITDVAYTFFAELEMMCRKELTHTNLVEHGNNLHYYLQTKIKENSKLFESFLLCNFPVKRSCEEREAENACEIEADSTGTLLKEIELILSGIIACSENYIDVYHTILDLFLCVNLSQFRRDYLAHVQKEKGKALRKKVMEKSKKVAGKIFNMKLCMEDNSVKKISSHLRLKSELMNNPKYFMDKSFTKKELQIFSKAYDLTLQNKL